MELTEGVEEGNTAGVPVTVDEGVTVGEGEGVVVEEDTPLLERLLLPELDGEAPKLRVEVDETDAVALIESVEEPEGVIPATEGA